jgi:hypothetical protein
MVTSDDDATAQYSERHFGRADARPRITQCYVEHRWIPNQQRGQRLSSESARTLRSQGIYMVRVRYRFRTFEVQIARYLDL